MEKFPTLHRRAFVLTTACGLAAPALLGSGGARAAESTIVEIENGRLRGAWADGALSFKGIPYAADTGGRNRFMGPRPAPNWGGVRDALQFGDRSPQGAGAVGAVGEARFSENCCVLNVFTPDLNSRARRPVLVYVHGGGFRSGSGEGIDGAKLAKFGDVVVVTVNHRLNLFGYLPIGHLHPDFADAANAGQLDLIAVLGWIKANIAQFGGDAGNVTIGGSSGGGSKVAALMVMPSSKGLFHRAYNQSGSTANDLRPAADSEPLIDAFLRRLNVDKSNPHRLQALPPSQLLAAYAGAVDALGTDDYRAVIDGRHIPHGTLTPEGIAVNGSVPVMIGHTNSEAVSMVSGDARSVTDDQLRARIKAQFGVDDAQVAAVVEGYRREVPTRTPWDILVAFASDIRFRGLMIEAGEALARNRRAPVYMYNFAWQLPNGGGSPHGVDVPFAFYDIDPTRTGAGEGPQKVALSLASAFVAFARTGNPNNPQIPQWRPFVPGTRPTMVIDETCRLVNDFRGGDLRATSGIPKQEQFKILGGPLFRYRA